MATGARPKTRHQSGTQLLKEYVGVGKPIDKLEVPTVRAVLQQCILLKDDMVLNDESSKNQIGSSTLAKKVAPIILAQWHKSNVKFCPPVIITEKSLVSKVDKLWNRVTEVARGRAKKAEKEKVDQLLDKLLDITTCPHKIMLCDEPGSACTGTEEEECKVKAHINCTCLMPSKLPVMELQWLYMQRNKIGEKSIMKMGGVDWKETEVQEKAAKNKADKEKAEVKAAKKRQKELDEKLAREKQARQFMAEEDEDEPEENPGTDLFIPADACELSEKQKKEADDIVDKLLDEKLGQCAHMVVRYLSRSKPKRNTMPVMNTAKASLRCCVSPVAAATIASEFLKDLIAAGYLGSDMAFLACDPSKLVRARRDVMEEAREQNMTKHTGVKIVGIGYDGRKDKHTRAMVSDSFGQVRMRMIDEEHVSVSEEPSGKYLAHFVPDEPIHPEKPALKTAEALYAVLEKYNSVDSLQILQGDSTNTNTGWKGGSHAHLENLLGRKLYWAICNLHTNELPLRHLIELIDGPTSSDKGFSGPVCSLLSQVEQMEFNPRFNGMPDGEALITIPEEVLEKMSTDQKTCYKLVLAVKAGKLPPEMQEMLCGMICHSRWLTTGQRIIFLWTRKHGLSGATFKVLEMLVKFCLEWYFKLYFDIKVKHFIADAPYHILTSLRILRTQPKKVRDAVTFYIRTGAWYAHSECLLLSLLASTDPSDRRFAVDQILKLRGHSDSGDTSVRPRVTPKLNLSATSLTKLITWKAGNVDEPVLTCSMTRAEIKSFLDKPYDPPKFSCHTQSTERCVKLVTEAAAAVCGQEARDGYIRARIHHREAMPIFTTKKHILSTF